MFGALAIATLILSFAPPATIGPSWMLAMLGVLCLAWVLLAPPSSMRDDVLPALAVVLAAVGLAVVARVAPSLAQKQQLWLLVSLLLAIAAGPAFTQFRRFAAYKYLWVVASLILFVLLLVFGEEINGARLWIKFGPIEYEPIELIKLFIVLFLAAYLAEMADVIASARPWSLRANLKYLGPLFVGWGASMAILVLQRDLGMATLLLATFATLLFVATRRGDIVIFGAAIFAAVAVWAMRHYPYVQTRVAVWRNPFSDPLGAGFQSSQAYYALAAGGLFGTGYRLGHPGFIPDVATDYVYAAFSEEFGLIGAIVLLVVFLGLVWRILATGLEQPDLYTKLLAAGLGATMGFQIFIIIGGVVGLFPLTGITLPFISYGGSSLVANFLLV
ncbi:MAG: FtsW/RodA/SpoVE family cell cycle protein, partial [Candidatus Eremiobacteraeota bacterium]|nr:FtsW/RodA/SpoVE family cell cycle protein [Candidatus Eremiobacteraeota bacterium]